jgi:hypothetical protein
MAACSKSGLGSGNRVSNGTFFVVRRPFLLQLPGAGTSIYEQLFAFLAGLPAGRSNPNIFSGGALRRSQIYDTQK